MLRKLFNKKKAKLDKPAPPSVTIGKPPLDHHKANIDALSARLCIQPDFRPGMRKPTDEEVRPVREANTYHGPVLVQVPGAKDFWMYSQNDDNVCLNYFYCGRGCYETVSTVAFALLSQDATNVMDLGGHTGLFSFIAASSSERTTAHYFEIMPLIAERARINARISGLAKRVRVNNVGLSRTSGRMNVRYNEKWPMWTGASLEAIADRDRLQGAVQREVEVIRLDDYWNAHGRFECSLAKLDVEGHELAVFEGAEEFLRVNKPVLLCEILSLQEMEQFSSALAAFGYDSIYEIDDRHYQLKELGSDLTYKNGGEYNFTEFHNALFSAGPLSADLPAKIANELRISGIIET